MTPHEYWSERGRLGQALRDVRWERRALSEIFRGTKDPDIICQATEWLRMLVAQDINLSRKIIALDVQYGMER